MNYYQFLVMLCGFDWIIRFYEDVGSVSDEQIQEIWGSIISSKTVVVINIIHNKN